MQNQESNLDANLIIQSFQEKINQLTLENVLKDATIKQLSLVVEELRKLSTIEKADPKKEEK
jgi:hypothetical protein